MTARTIRPAWRSYWKLWLLAWLVIPLFVLLWKRFLPPPGGDGPRGVPGGGDPEHHLHGRCCCGTSAPWRSAAP